EIDFLDARKTGERQAEMKALAHEIEMMKGERLAKFDEALAKAQHEGVDMKVMHERRRVVERNTEVLEREHTRQLQVMERDAGFEDRAKAREEQRKNAAEDRATQLKNRDEDRQNLKKTREEDRDYDNESKVENAQANLKAGDYGRDGKTRDADADLHVGK